MWLILTFDINKSHLIMTYISLSLGDKFEFILSFTNVLIYYACSMNIVPLAMRFKNNIESKKRV